MEVDQLETAQDLTQLLRTLAWVFPSWPLLSARSRSGSRPAGDAIVRLLAWGFVLGGVLVLVIRGVSGSYVVDELATTSRASPRSRTPGRSSAPAGRRRLVADHPRRRRHPRRAVHRRRPPRD